MIYEYICDNCEFIDSYFHKMDEKPEFICPECGEKMRKQIGLNFVLKGGGYYSTGNDTPKAVKTKQTVMAVDPNHIDKVDNKIVKNAAKAKVVEPV